jgi:hypothetical protein
METETDLSAITKRRAAIRTQIAKLMAEDEELATTLQVLERFGITLDYSTVTVSRVDESLVIDGKTTGNRFEGMSQPEVARQILLENGTPMRAPDVVAKMVEAGYPCDNRTRLKNNMFTSMTRRDDLFEKVESGLWALKAWATANEATTTADEAGATDSSVPAFLK